MPSRLRITVLPMVFKNLGSAVHNGQDCSSGYEFSENLLKNIAIQVKSSNFRKGKDWKAVMGGLPILISIDDEVFLRGVLSGEEWIFLTISAGFSQISVSVL